MIRKKMNESKKRTSCLACYYTCIRVATTVTLEALYNLCYKPTPSVAVLSCLNLPIMYKVCLNLTTAFV